MVVSPIYWVGKPKSRKGKSPGLEVPPPFCPSFLPSPPCQLVLLELNFLPTTGTKLTKQQLILARESHWGWGVGMGWSCGKNGSSGGQGGTQSPPKSQPCHPQVTYWRLGPSGASYARTSPPLNATWPSSNATTSITSEDGPRA